MVGVTVVQDNTHLYELFRECACLYVGRSSCNWGINGQTNNNREKDVVPNLVFNYLSIFKSNFFLVFDL